jgi:hypothetical protein
VYLFPGDGLTPEIKGHTTTHDHGFLVRLTPYDSIDHEGFLPGLDAAIAPLADGLRFDLSFGLSKLNDSGETIEWTFGDADPVARIERQGFATRVALALPASVRTDLEARGADWVASALTPILAVGLAWDEEQETYEAAGGTERRGLELGSHGIEITLFNVLTLRNGEYETWNDFQNIEETTRSTWGWGLGFQVEGLGGVYFDRAQVQSAAAEFSNHEPTTFGFWMDPRGLWRKLRL